MEIWQRDFEWLRVRHIVRDAMGREQLPDLQSILFLIGVQELGRINKQFSKEEKRDLMHVAVCTLLEKDGYYEFEGRDQDGWPHYKELRRFDLRGEKDQETFLIEKVIEYFAAYNELTPFSLN
jgi:hypothetical protein